MQKNRKRNDESLETLNFNDKCSSANDLLTRKRNRFQNPSIIAEHKGEKSEGILDKEGLVINLDLENGKVLSQKDSGLSMKECNSRLKSLLNVSNYEWDNADKQKLLEAILLYSKELEVDLGYKKSFNKNTLRHNSQKLLVKLKKKSIFDVNIDLGKSSSKKLNEMAKTLNSEFYLKSLRNLKFVAFERKTELEKNESKSSSPVISQKNKGGNSEKTTFGEKKQEFSSTKERKGIKQQRKLKSITEDTEIFNAPIKNTKMINIKNEALSTNIKIVSFSKKSREDHEEVCDKGKRGSSSKDMVLDIGNKLRYKDRKIQDDDSDINSNSNLSLNNKQKKRDKTPENKASTGSSYSYTGSDANSSVNTNAPSSISISKSQNFFSSRNVNDSKKIVSNINQNTQQILKIMAKNTYSKSTKNTSFNPESSNTELFFPEEEKGCFQEFFGYSFFDNDNKNQDYLSEVDYSEIYCGINEGSRLFNNKGDDDIFKADDFLSSNNKKDYAEKFDKYQK